MNVPFGLRPGHRAAALRRHAAQLQLRANRVEGELHRLAEVHRQLLEESAALLVLAQITHRMESVK